MAVELSGLGRVPGDSAVPANLEARKVELRHVEFTVHAGVPEEAPRDSVAEPVGEMRIRAQAAGATRPAWRGGVADLGG